MSGLLIVAVTSLVVAAILFVVSWKWRREHRARDRARIDLLRTLAFDSDDAVPEPVAMAPRLVADFSAHARVAARTIRETPAPASESWDVPLPDTPAIESAEPMFGTVVETGAPNRRWVALAAVAVVLALSVGAYSAMYDGGDKLQSTPAQTAAATGATAAAPAPASRPIELVSLRHSTDRSGNFVVTGLVQNPANGQPLRGVVAVVYLFDRQDQYLASAKAAVEVPVLQAGSDSPFVVTVPKVGGVARYRIGFRSSDGAAIAHVDQRGQATGKTVVGAARLRAKRYGEAALAAGSSRSSAEL